VHRGRKLTWTRADIDTQAVTAAFAESNTHTYPKPDANPKPDADAKPDTNTESSPKVNSDRMERFTSRMDLDDPQWLLNRSSPIHVQFRQWGRRHIYSYRDRIAAKLG
jgi:hypothetical protein